MRKTIGHYVINICNNILKKHLILVKPQTFLESIGNLNFFSRNIFFRFLNINVITKIALELKNIYWFY